MSQSETRSIPASEVAKRFDHYRYEAATGPILISEDGCPDTVLLSYDEFVRLKRRDRHAHDLDDLPQHLVTAIFEAEVPGGLDDDPGPARARP